MTLHRCLTVAAFLLTLCSAAGQVHAEPPEMDCVVDPSWPQKPDSFIWGALSGVVVDAQDQVYIFNRSEPTVQIYDAEGTLVRSWSTGNPKGTHHIKLDPDGNVWVADFRDHVVQKYSPDGKCLLTLGEAGQSGCDEGHFNGPTDMAFSPGGDVFISDGYGNRRVVHFDKDGRFVKAWGEEGTEPGQFALPHGVAIDSLNRIYVADRNNARTQVFDTDGKLQAVWDDYLMPWGYAVTKNDEIWTCGSTQVRQPDDDGWVITPPLGQLLVKFNTQGKALLRAPLTMPSADGSKPGDIDWVHCIAVDSKGRIYLGDIEGKRVQRFLLRP
jgi:WD40 repeat protein